MPVLYFADAGEAADLAAFLGRLLHYDKAAAVRLQAQAGGQALAVFGRPPSFEVLAIRAARLLKPYENGIDDSLDVTVSAGELLDSVDESAASALVPAAVTGPPWAGVLPPRGGWERVEDFPGADELRGLVKAAVGEFRARVEELAPEARTRTELDRIGRTIWSREIGASGAPVRIAHAAVSLGFLRGPSVDLLASGPWVRLRTAYGSVAVRRSAAGASGLGGLAVTPA
ncbi:hypothetical protein [Streptomyces sp. VRA16 Mangrove soil]|uniref:hypothetical protein n=1 Tax=Streptomyces sp. VRA16 Mangrove soil TaxID=2817434 RepID=UPI001A9ED35C|nr:hypothetical protein [Streptomyces sp. VRA16 Mangrove soil]MBO1334056.1 hypothetical protein [Streptomyces sp. VRA16 Mangrove soil]